MKYHIVRNHIHSQQVDEVNRLLSEGWEPYGALSVVKDEGGYEFFQAMIKREAAESSPAPAKAETDGAATKTSSKSATKASTKEPSKASTKDSTKSSAKEPSKATKSSATKSSATKGGAKSKGRSSTARSSKTTAK